MSGLIARSVHVAELLLDTDVFVDHIRGARRLPVSRPAAYSVITRCELFAGDAKDEPVVRALLASHAEIEVVAPIAERAGRLQRDISRLRTPDALIAATALERDLELVTRNRRDFAAVPGLRVRDPASLNP